MNQWHGAGADHARMHAHQHHVKRKLQESQRQRDMHHNIAEAGSLTDNRRPWLLTRLWRRFWG